MTGSVVFVHGTGVRLAGYDASVDTVRAQMAAAGLTQGLEPCAWGDPLGVTFTGLSLPDPPDASPAVLEDRARWGWLFDDPLLELERLSIRGADAAVPTLGRPRWLTELERLRAYVPSAELDLLLDRAQLREAWEGARQAVMFAPITALAFERSEEAGELADCAQAMARSLIAQMHVQHVALGRPAPSEPLRDRIYQRLLSDWNWRVHGLGVFVAGLAQRAATAAVRRRRATVNQAVAGPLGDILLYQARGAEIRDFIRAKVLAAPPPVILLGHSLGGVACVDLMAMGGAPPVAMLVTFGSQAAFFHEIGALPALAEGDPLPAAFPPWLNVYDRDDFLSFVAERVFPGQVRDFEVRSGQPFPDSHGAYFANEAMWAEIARVAP